MSAASSPAIPLHLFRQSTQARGVGAEIPHERRGWPLIGQQVVERFATGRTLQPIDAAEAAIVQAPRWSASIPSMTDVAISEFSIR